MFYHVASLVRPAGKVVNLFAVNQQPSTKQSDPVQKLASVGTYTVSAPFQSPAVTATPEQTRQAELSKLAWLDLAVRPTPRSSERDSGGGDDAVANSTSNAGGMNGVGPLARGRRSLGHQNTTSLNKLAKDLAKKN